MTITQMAIIRWWIRRSLGHKRELAPAVAVTAWKSSRRSFSMQRLIHAAVQVHLQVLQKSEA